MSWRHFRAITVKEFRHIRRDKGTLLLFTLMPTLLLLLLAYAVTADIEHVPIAVLDLDRSPTSRAFVQQITIGGDLDLHAFVGSTDEYEQLLLRGDIKAAVVIPPSFEHDLLAVLGMPMQIIVDGTEPQSGGFAVDRIGRRAEEFVTRILSKQFNTLGAGAFSAIDLRVRTWFNPNLKPSVDLLPGLISMVLGLPGMSVALTLAREREHGTIEQLIATPIGRAELILGKMAPYILSGLLNVFLTTAIARFWFGVPFRGNFLLFLGLSSTFFFAVLSMGMIIGVLVHTQPAALALSMLLIFFPGFFLTGIFFPIASMPPIVQMEALALPGTHYAIITRGIFITASGIDILWPNGLALVLMGIAFTAISAFLFKKKLA
jgi:ABC-2 type transport system permease protein